MRPILLHSTDGGPSVPVDLISTLHLLAVARGGQRNLADCALKPATLAEALLFAVARWGQRNCSYQVRRPKRNLIVSRHPATLGFYSLSRDGDSGTMPRLPRQRLTPFLFAVAKWGQRNSRAPLLA